MTPHEQQVYANFTVNLKRFAANAANAAQEIRQGQPAPSEKAIQELADSAVELEGGCGEVGKLDDPEITLHMYLVQNVLHSPVHPNRHSGKNVSLYHAATSWRETHSADELTEIIKAGARNPNQMERMVNNLYRICAQINQMLRSQS